MANRKERRAAAKPKGAVHLVNEVEWQSGENKGESTHMVFASPRAIKRVSGGRTR